MVRWKWVVVKPGLWTLDWTVDWTVDWNLDVYAYAHANPSTCSEKWKPVWSSLYIKS